MRAVWPADRPMSVHLSAHDWAPGGTPPDDAVTIAQLFKATGCDFIDVSSGQTTRQTQPIYGRMYQTPFADRIRNEADIPTIAVGALTEVDPTWTLHEDAELQSRAIEWPRQYLSGRDQLYREMTHQKAVI